MNAPTTLREPGARLGERTLEQLLAEAETFGAIQVYSNAKDRTVKRYRVSIAFATTTGITLEAKSEFGMGVHEAFEQAIARAKQIVGQFK